MRVIVSTLVLASLLFGCGGGDTTDAGNSGVELTYHRSGGLPGVDETLRIHRSGSATLVTFLYPVGEGETSTTRFRLSEVQGERLRAALEESGFDDFTPPDRSDVVCIDCLTWEIATPANQVRLNQPTPPPELKPLLARLDAIVAANLPDAAQQPNPASPAPGD